MSEETTGESLRERLSRQGEEALGRIAQDMLENPLVSGALQRGFEAREKASQAQEAAMGALNLPSAADLERLTRRVRSVGQRLEGIEDGVDRLTDKLTGSSGGRGDERLAAMEQRLESLDAAIGQIAASLSSLPTPQAPERKAAPRKAAPRKATPRKAAPRKAAAKPAAKPKPAAARTPRKPAA